MYVTKTIFEKLRLFFVIFLPIFVSQIGLSLMNFFDSTMSGQYNAIDLAGVAIAGSIWSPVYTGLNGILLAVTPIVSQALGANKKKDVSSSVFQALYVALVIGVVIIILGSVFLNPILNLLQLEESVYQVAFHYLVALSFGIIPLLVYNVLRCFMDALGQTKITMLITLSSVPINVGLNYIFIYGYLGIPAFGGVGAGIASSITYWIILIIAIFVVKFIQPFSVYQIFQRLHRVHLKTWKELFKIGLPIGFSIFFETSIFAIITMLMSAYNTFTIAAYQAALNFTSILYMIPLSVSMALTILVGFEVGGNRYRDAKQYSFLGIGLAVFVSFFSAMILYFFRFQIASLYTTEQQVLELIASFLLFALLFQLSDAIQASAQGALRGYKDVNTSFFTTLIAYWVIGLPVGYILANFTELGPNGYWIGLISGLSAGAIGLISRLIYIQNRIQKKLNAKVQ